MSISRHFVLILVSTFAIIGLAPSIGAIDVGCVRADSEGNARVLSPPGGAFLNWAPECVIIPNGGSVTWTNADAIAHGAISDGCFSSLGRIGLGASQTLSLDFDAESGLLLTTENGAPGACAATVEGNAITIVYDCVIHGAAMTASIVVEL